ncbi:hypothetical protein D918_08035 [Trichuris suis]|nr:hypothetical protein D918_08035 [Trichuris suis]
MSDYPSADYTPTMQGYLTFALIVVCVGFGLKLLFYLAKGSLKKLVALWVALIERCIRSNGHNDLTSVSLHVKLLIVIFGDSLNFKHCRFEQWPTYVLFEIIVYRLTKVLMSGSLDDTRQASVKLLMIKSLPDLAGPAEVQLGTSSRSPDSFYIHRILADDEAVSNIPR